MKAVILTGSELRHDFMRMAIAQADGIEVLRSYCESAEGALRSTIDPNEEDADFQIRHLDARDRSEEDFFAAFVKFSRDGSKPKRIRKGDINTPHNAEKIQALTPDLLVAYGCSLIREPLLSAFAGRFLNLHLGLSPYYRGAGTNFWPLVNNEPEYVGATFMHIDAGVDTGRIVHQIRARVHPGDTPHQIGNRLIADAARAYIDIIAGFDRLAPVSPPPLERGEKVYKRRDFSVESVRRLYANFENGMIGRYMEDQAARDARAPISENPALGRDART